jgi:GT2 family glycosyltransferase
MDVSIILVNYNTKDMTRDCLHSVYQYTKDIDFEVFVVDNNSHDGSVEMIEEEFPQVRLIKNPDNKGFGAANNIAIRLSEAKYIFCLNTDTLLLSNSIKAFYDFMEKEENHNVSACGCQLLDKNMKPQHSYAKFHTVWQILSTIFYMHKILPKTYRRLFVDSELENATVPYVVDYVTGADLFLRKSVINELGMYDENFFMYSEESEMQFRFKKAGYKSVIIPYLNIVHFCDFKSKNAPIAKLEMMFKSDILYYKKCHGLLYAIICKFLYIIKFIVTPRLSKRYLDLIVMAVHL